MKINGKLIWRIIAATIFIISVFAFIFRFQLRLMIPFKYHYFTTVMILLLIIFNIINIIIFGVKVKIRNWIKPILIVASIIGYIFILTKVTTNNRKEEMAIFLQENEQKLNSVVKYIYENNIKARDDNDVVLSKKLNDLNLRYYVIKKDILFLCMFKFPLDNDGYGIAYSENEYDKEPKVSYYLTVPYTDWFKIKDNWYYYEKFD